MIEEEQESDDFTATRATVVNYYYLIYYFISTLVRYNLIKIKTKINYISLLMLYKIISLI